MVNVASTRLSGASSADAVLIKNVEDIKHKLTNIFIILLNTVFKRTAPTSFQKN
jgi:hypothetical protein